MSNKVLKNNPASWFPKTVNILGTEYECRHTIESEDIDIKNRFGYIWYRMHQIVIRDLYRDPEWTHEPEKLKKINMQEALRHEILHGFLFESGLAESTIQIANGWSKNEEMVDWFALQALKIFQAYQQAGCL